MAQSMHPAPANGPYKVPRQHDGWRSLTLAGAMHLGLLLFLWIGISWQNSKPVAVEAEIWDAQVQQAAPAPKPEPTPAPEPDPEPAPAPKAPPPPVAPPVETPPAPKAPDIALERQKAKLKAEKEKQEAAREAKLKQEAEEKQAKLEAKKAAEKKAAEQKARDEKEAREQAEKDKEKADKDKADKEKKLAAEKKAKAEKAAQAKLDAVRAEEMKRITGAVGAGTTGTAAKSTGPKGDPSYEAAIRAKIKGNLVYSTADDTLSATFIITQLPTGEVIGIRKKKGSGSAAYDSAIENAITKSSPLPKKKDGTVEREIIADFNMKDLH